MSSHGSPDEDDHITPSSDDESVSGDDGHGISTDDDHDISNDGQGVADDDDNNGSDDDESDAEPDGSREPCQGPQKGSVGEDDDSPSDSGNDDDDSSVSHSILNEERDKEELEELVDQLRATKRELKTKRRNSKARLLEQTRIQRLRGTRPPPIPWQDRLRKYLQEKGNLIDDEDGLIAKEGDLSYKKVYRESCKQENMSQKLGVAHPDIKFGNRKLDDWQLSLAYPSQDPRVQLLWPPHDMDRRMWSIVLPNVFHRRQPPSQMLLEPAPFRFEELPKEIQARIFRIWFEKDTLVHCLSRLDYYHPPKNFPAENRPKRSELPKRFHIGTRTCNVSAAVKPNNLLKPLLVCKRWFFIGAHAFYGTNTFAFSSLGELGRFFKGIGRARLQRIQHVELMWHGALMRTNWQTEEDENGKEHKYKVSDRTLPLESFTMTSRLKTLLVHIDESAKWRMRRRYEMPCPTDYERDFSRGAIHKLSTFGKLMKRTDMQPNWRRNRSMRTVQGMDYLYQLRGMRWIRFKDVSAPEYRANIRDWSFINDMNTAVTSPKEPRYAMQSELQNLTPLTGLRVWEPSDDDMDIIRGFYNEDADELVGGSETSASEGSTFGTLSHVSGNSDPDSDEDGDEGGFRGGNPLGDIMDLMGVDKSDIEPEDGGAPTDVDVEQVNPNASSEVDGDGSDFGSAANGLQPSGSEVVDLTLEDEGGDDDDNGSASEDLFVPWASGSGYTTVTPSDDGGRRRQTTIDLTGGAGASTDVKSESSSTQAERRRRLVIDLTGDRAEVKEESPFIGKGGDFKRPRTEDKTDDDGFKVPLAKRPRVSPPSSSGGSERSSVAPGGLMGAFRNATS
ncbi:hypothetical protein DL764_001691 [Monosporascus ibericus]|uniref:Uncharacterized protein n=1 Tax=Monosporascus ibericus TaxID=155417 RepID=A0A4Q4TT51_9PEZI|nr:hypothetical protein DL764_001691 [Monosporascus ibericus]